MGSGSRPPPSCCKRLRSSPKTAACASSCAARHRLPQRQLLPVGQGLDGPRQPGRGDHRAVRGVRGRPQGAKASFESFVTVSDPDASAKLAKYKGMLGDMENNLPVDDAIKTERGHESPIRVVDLVFTAGDARKSVQTIAYNLPNDERVRKEKGAKKVLLRNAIQRKFDRILRPIAEPHPRSITDEVPVGRRLLQRDLVPRAVAQPRPRPHHRQRQEDGGARGARDGLHRARGGARPTPWAPTTCST